jgi:arginine:ornithine antiporter/lysine permease
MLVWTLFNDSTYTDLIYLATSLILLPYLWSALYQVKLTVTGESYTSGYGATPAGRAKDLVIGAAALAYAVWLVYAGGIDYVFIAALFYLAGTALFMWARKQGDRRLFTRTEMVLVGVVVAGSVAAVIGLVQGWVQV